MRNCPPVDIELRPDARNTVVDGRVLERLQIVNAILRRLDRDVVVDAVFRVEPKAGRSLEAGT